MDPVHTSFLHAISSGYQFTEAFGALAELDWEETPYGMCYIATRRIGDLVWVRVADFMAPNVHQFTREIEEAKEERAASRPVVIRWAVPIDDTETWNMELAQVDPAWGLTAEDVARPGFGQSDDRPYAERQRHPADYDAQSSQRPIAVHALEHLASTDRGVIMLRGSCATASARSRPVAIRASSCGGPGLRSPRCARTPCCAFRPRPIPRRTAACCWRRGAGSFTAVPPDRPVAHGDARAARRHRLHRGARGSHRGRAPRRGVRLASPFVVRSFDPPITAAAGRDGGGRSAGWASAS